MFKVNNKFYLNLVKNKFFDNLQHIPRLVFVFLLLTLNMQLPAGNNVWRQWRGSRAFIVNFEHILHLFLAFLLLTFNK